MAIKTGIQVKGVGWASCCPPLGRKADIVQALIDKKEKDDPGMEELFMLRDRVSLPEVL